MTAEVARVGRGGSVALAAAAAVAISTVYLPQALVGPIAADLDVPLSTAGLVATTAQLAYAIGIVLLVPLGDVVRPRRLITALFAVTALALVGAALAPSWGVLAAAFAVGGAACVVPAVLIPLAGAMSSEGSIGRTIAAVGTGIGIGIFGSRIAAGVVAEAFGWRLVPVVFAALSLIICAVLLRVLPRRHPVASVGYLSTLRRLPRLLVRKRVLRGAVWMQFWIFSAMNAAWTVIVVYLSEQLGWPLAAAGAFAVVGLVAAGCTPLAGHLIDRRGARATLTIGLVSSAAAVVVLALLPAVPAALVVGYFVLTLAAQASQIAQQTRIFAESPGDRSAVNTVFTGSLFAGGALGATLSIPVYTVGGLSGVALLVGGCVALSALGLLSAAGRTAAAPRAA